MASEDLLGVESHFQFGRNWADYARSIDDGRIVQAMQDLERLLAGTPIAGKRFLDIGCGSGLHALAALRLGAAEIVAVDLDPDSVATTAAVIGLHAPDAKADVRVRSVFDLDPQRDGQFDIVYSWGVLHHTGDMDRALRNAAAMVKPGGAFLFALYRKTPFCGAWSREKRWYAHASPSAQRVARGAYIGLGDLARLLKGITPGRYRREYGKSRGMNFFHDVHDWLGGYPYESISPADVDSKMRDLGLSLRSRWTKPAGSGILGSGCDEFAYVRQSS